MSSKFKLRISIDNEPLIKAKGNKITDFDPILDGLKEKFNENKKKK